MQIKCPMCSRVLDVPHDYQPRPFCSARCKLADLDNWLSEKYRIAGSAGDEPIDGAMVSDPRDDNT